MGFEGTGMFVPHLKAAPPLSFPWKVMAEAAYRKYPNPHSSHVHSLDTLQRRVAGRTIYSHRLFCANWSIPNLVLKVKYVD